MRLRKTKYKQVLGVPVPLQEVPCNAYAKTKILHRSPYSLRISLTCHDSFHLRALLFCLHDYGFKGINDNILQSRAVDMMLPCFFQSRLSVVSARIRAFSSFQSSDNPFYHSSHICQGAATDYKNDTDSPDSHLSKSHSSTPSNSRKAIYTPSSVVAREGDEVASSSPSGGVMATPDVEDDLRYEQLVRHLLRTVNKDVDSNNTRPRQTDAWRLLEGPPLPQLSQPPPPHALEIAAIHGQQQRLPPNFNGQAHDAVDQRWSPSGIKWRYARQGEYKKNSDCIADTERNPYRVLLSASYRLCALLYFFGM